MIKKNIITIVTGTIALFIWNATSWMGLPFHTNTLKNIPEKVMQTNVLKKEMPQSGVYHYPGLPANNSATAMKAIEQKLAQGPRITLMVYKNSPTKLFDPTIFIKSLLINLLTVVLALLVISTLAIKLPKMIFLATLGLGVIAALVGDLSQMNWYLMPIDYTLVNAMDKLVAFGILGALFSVYTFKEVHKNPSYA